MINILFTVEKIGPYHNSRFNDLRNFNKINLNILETNHLSNRYPWKDSFIQNYKVFNLKKRGLKYEKSNIKTEINQIIENCSPNVIFIAGWNEKISNYLLFISHIKKIPVIILSDSRFKDSKRNIISELIKSILLKGCSGAIVAGTESESYLIKLGLKKKEIFKPYDVIDNNYFFDPKNNAEPKKYILSIGRFIKKKNHIRLIRAFANYKKDNGKLNLLLIGEGPEKTNIEKTIEKLSSSRYISIKSWQSISELKKSYSKAKVFVLFSEYDQWGLVVNEAMASGIPCIVSTECGCYKDLIKDKKTGWGVNPLNEQELTDTFHKVEKLKNKELLEMQNNIHKVIKGYNLNNFSIAVKDSSIYALKKRKFSKISAITAYLLYLLK